MTEANYNNRMERLQRFIPFLENMIEQLKDPKMKNREQQLKKMESLYGMITDKKKKLKIETLIKCEEVIVKLYQKVKGEHADLPPTNSNKVEKRKSVDIYSMAGESLNRSKDSNQLNSPNKSQIPKSFFLRKPPISYEDLEVLEKDVASELERKMSLQELNSLRKELCQQLQEDTQKINTTVRNKPALTRLNPTTPDKNRKQHEKSIPEVKNVTNDTKGPLPSTSKKTEDMKPPKIATPKVLKESDDIFSNAFSEIDNSYKIEAKKREERRSSTSKDKKDKEEIIAEKIAHVRQLAEKAAELRTKKIISTNCEVPSTSKELDKAKGVPPTDSVGFKSSGNMISEEDVSELADQVNKIKKTLNKNEMQSEKDISKNEIALGKIISPKESRDDHCKDKTNYDQKKDSNDRKSDHRKNHKSDGKKEEKNKDKRVEKDKKDGDKKIDNEKDNEKLKKDDKTDKNNEDDVKICIETKTDNISNTHINENVVTDDKKNKMTEKIKSTETIPNELHEIPKEIKQINRDPRLKYGATATTSKCIPVQNPENFNRLAYKYNPKPKRTDNEPDIEQNVADSIEKSMKESYVPLPPKPRLEAPPAPPEDLFSPQSPDELDKAPVPAILNDILLNPKTTGVINEVVSALQRSNNEKNLLPLVNSGNIFNHEMDSLGLSNDANATVFEKQPLFGQFRQTANRAFSPPSQKFSAPTLDCQRFLQPKPVPLPLMNNSLPRGFNPFTTTMDKNNTSDEMPALDFQPTLNAVSNFERSGNPPHLTPYEDRIGQSSFNLERSLNFVPPSPSYVPPSPSYSAPSNFIPPSPNYVPPSPVYDGNNDNFRDLHINNYHNFSNERSGHMQGFFEKDRVRSQGLLGDFPQMPYNSQYGNQNYDTFYNNQTNFMESRKPFYGSAIRDPRVNMNRGNQFHCNEPRLGRDSRMTYREYKEQKERENRGRGSREREIRDRENRERDSIERQRKDREGAALREQEDVGATTHHKEENRENDGIRKKWDRNRSRERSASRYSRRRSSSRYRGEQENRRNRSKERLRLGESRFDKVYSSRDIDKEDFTSPLDSLYTSSKAKTGKGYGVQFKIPKLVKEEEKQKKDDIIFEKSKEKVDDDYQAAEKIKHGTRDTTEQKHEIIDKEENEEKKVSKSDKNQRLEEVDSNINNEDIIDKTTNVALINEDVIEIKTEVPVVEVIHSPEKVDSKIKNVDTENNQSPIEKTEDSKIPETNGKKEEEESILSKFFQNLMKSSNKDEKKGALLSLISTFSDSFSDQQLKRITNIIRSEENVETDQAIDKTEKDKNLQEIERVDEQVELTPTEKKEIRELNVNHEKDVEDNLVQVSVGERIKNRKRAETVKNDTKVKIRSKTELDRLHEDIREMFIRDGVVTATGKRMCRILKDNITESDRTVDQNLSDEVKKKAPMSKKKGRKGSTKKNPSVDLEMRELSVILPKISFDELKESGDHCDKRYSLRKPVKSTNYNEIDNEEVKSKATPKKPDVTDEMVESSDDLEEEESKDEVDNSVDELKKFKTKKKTRKSWAAGVIRKKAGGKTKKAKNPTTHDSDEIIERSADLPKKMPYHGEPLYLHDKDYYYKPDMTTLPCKVCDFSTKWIAAHYRSEHPDIEVLSSRLPPDVAQIAIEDAIANKELYEEDNEVSSAKHQYTCRFCDYSQNTLPRMYRDHVSIHTGEFRHRCPYCNYRRSHIKSMQTHVNEVHANEIDKLKRRIISQPAVSDRNIYGYICEECNYTQMSLQNIQHHVKMYHSENKSCKIYKIIMNPTNKPKIEITSNVVQERVETTSIKDRPSTRSAKIAAKNSDIDDDNTTDMDLEDELQNMNNSEEEYKSLNIEQAEQITDAFPIKQEAGSAAIDSETNNTSMDEPVERKSRKRKKSFAKPGPAKRRGQKTVVSSSISSTDTETESDSTRSSPRKRNERNKPNDVSHKKIDKAVFTCNTDLQEENKQIEEERLRKMQDINSTIKLRTSLEFVEKLSNRLKQEDEVMVKTEPLDVDENTSLYTVAPNELPVYEKSVLQKRELEHAVVRHEGSPEVSKEGGKVNTIMKGVIEKLRGVLSNTSPPDDVNDLPPPLKHIDRIERKFDRELNSVALNIGPIKVLKSGETYIYTCCTPPCIFSSRDQKVFENHCRSDHYWNENSEKFPNCLECNTKIECSETNPLLLSSLQHARNDHSSFLNNKIGSIRVSSNLFPETKKEMWNTCELPSETSTSTANTSRPKAECASDDSIICSEEIPAHFEDENPFSFKIVDVVSLAEDDIPPLSIIDNQIKSGNVDNELIVPETNTAPLSPIKKSTEKIVKSPIIPVENHPRKSVNAMKKFLGTPNDLFKCPEFTCLFTTNKRKMFDIHIRMHPNQSVKSLCCLYCDKLVVLESMGDHYEQVHGMCRFACYYCLYRCIAKDYMDIHQLLVHSELPPRMRVLPYRDAVDKNVISILSEAAKSTPVSSYICCDEEFVYHEYFVSHLKNCPKVPSYVCQFKKENSEICGNCHSNVEELVRHWGLKHGVYPLQCGYCDVGHCELSEMMIHLVLAHPTLPPDVIDRFALPKHKNKSCPSRAQCNFKQLVTDLRSEPSKFKLSSSAGSLCMAPTTSSTNSRQKSIKNSAQQSNVQPFFAKAVTTYSKVTPVNIMPVTTSTITMIKASSSNVLSTGNVVYCLTPTSTAPNQLMKAIVVNKDSSTNVSSKVRLLSPVSLPQSDPKFQMIKSVHKVIPITSKMPRLAPIASRVISVPAIVQPLPLPVTTEAVSSEDMDLPLTESSERVAKMADQLTLEEGGEDNSTSNTAELANLEEPMVVINDDFEDKNQDEAVDPLSLDMEDPLTATKESQSYSGGTPLHEYDSDSKDTDHHGSAVMPKTGLVGYQLYRCAKCNLSFSENSNFKDHLINSVECKFTLPPNRPYKCAHCNRFLKHYSNLLDHLWYHGPDRFQCSICNKKYPHSNQAKQHMKSKHNLIGVVMKPLIQNKRNLNVDEFVMTPMGCSKVKTPIQEAIGESDIPKTNETKTIFFSHEADDIPQKSILSYDITCGHCKKFKNKVRSNIVRHLLLHKNDKDFTVPDTAPINPVPCLEKNEKMFDKMFNLASSSHAGGRMGGQQKGDIKKNKVTEEDYPAFVPTNKRFQCCAVGCNYLCLEEANLRHHLTALHMEDLNFVCVHCKTDLSDAADVDTILKHLKLHELHLYKCNACKFIHNLRHKVERHIGEKHKSKECSVIVLRAMDSEPFDENHQVLAPFPIAMNQKSMKLWRCCMCKYRCYTQDEAELHAKNKHDIECRYKCALCTFKSNIVSEFTGHFKTDHADNNVDIILAYHKDDDPNEASSEMDQFDTTPLWLRDKPRVRHIRGILFDENLPAKKKSSTLKTQVAENQPISGSTGSPLPKKRKRSTSAIPENSTYNEGSEDDVQMKTETDKAAHIPVLPIPRSEDDVIIIDDDEEDTMEQQASPYQSADRPHEIVVPERLLDDVDLLCAFGDVGIPVNKNFKCPKCDSYKTTKIRDFIQHVTKEISYQRFKCGLCDEKFITFDAINTHCIVHHDGLANNIPLPIDPSLKRWLIILLEKQSSIIRNLGFQTEDVPNDIGEFLMNYDSTSGENITQSNSSTTRIICKECGLCLFGTDELNLHYKFNHPHLSVDQSIFSNSKPSTSNQKPLSSVKRANDEDLTKIGELKKPRIMVKNTLIAKDKYACSLCDREFDSVPEMEFHGNEHHNGEITYEVHTTEMPMPYEYGRNTYRCRYCPTTGTKPSLKIHSSQEHPLQKPSLYRFSCGVCPAKFEVLKNLKQHFKSHGISEISYFDVHNNKVNLKPKIVNNTKIKLYKCPVCPYISNSINSNTIKTHLKIHARPFQCDLCLAYFKSRADARSHHLKEHPHNVETISERGDMIQKISELWEEVLRNVQIVQNPSETAAIEKDESVRSSEEKHIEEDPDLVIDVVGEEHKQEKEKLLPPKTKNFARKSTGRPVIHREEDEYYSFYGQLPEPVDMRKIVTTFEIADAKMRMTCDQLSRIYNLKPRLVLKDCMSLIIEDDELSS
ncbi:hypothetical protein WA026_002698 [Henosepilachna vigintioctopunctata]|uniref:C2H2-type domain-containing protein n=1 Tax=Henosepilachna vigintioctopunctata TaxID=420089 RepID=A0AAW1U072_9CUCU